MNTAIIPVPKLENDFYDWYQRHETKKAAAAARHYDLIFIGDSITHLFAGDPNWPDRGEKVWEEYYASRNALNLGYGWDRTQNVLYRLHNGEFAGQSPRLIVLNIGTNNLTGTANAVANTPAEILAGIEAIVALIRQAAPATRFLIMGIFPRNTAADPIRQQIRELNRLLRKMVEDGSGMTFMDIGTVFLDPQGEIVKELMPDLCHPSAAGYRLWAEAVEPVIAAAFTS